MDTKDKEFQSQLSTQFSDAFPSALDIKLADGSTAVFARLDLEDLSSWTNAIHQDWKARGYKLITGTMKPLEQFQAKRQLEFAKPSLDDIADACYLADGIAEALKRSLMKGGKTESQAKAIIKMVNPRIARNIARHVVTLFDVQVPGTPPKDDQDPAATTTGFNGLPITNTKTDLPDGQQNMGSIPPLALAASEESIGG